MLGKYTFRTINLSIPYTQKTEPPLQQKAIIVDDEAHCINTLRYELEENCPEVEEVASKVDAQLLADIHQAIHQRNDRISISTAKGLTFLPVADIFYCQSEKTIQPFIPQTMKPSLLQKH